MASDFLLEIDGIKGESKDDKHKDTIEIASFSWGASNSGSQGSGGGGGTGKVSFNDLSLTGQVSKASPLLFLACANGQHIKKATLYVRKSGGDAQDFYKISMEDLLVSSIQHSDSTGGGIPQESFSLNFAKVKLEYFEQKPDGSLGGATTFGWDVKANKKV
ncbi:Hcp family type VI secretion system effector [Zavarzinella formosa]|uniref:Hcp family type VI secretion system effector n=1 Tax=Zavarzinella formosa TaxID=360055 RepID=UPI00030242E0|nr:type VI secretion system tube protein Hcp [Zavarzinella formosa]